MAATKWVLARVLLPQLLLLPGIALLTLAFAPAGQFYLAWVGLVPLLLFLASAKSQKAAFFHTWAFATLFFIANMWWMAAITVPGMIALMIYCGIYWAFAAIIIRGAGLLSPRYPALLSVLLVPAVWIAFEWIRGVTFTGLPWLFLGQTQTPVLATCQIADITGVYGVSFWLVSLNTLCALAWMHRHHLGRVVPAALAVGGILILVVAYGIYRIQQTPASLAAGPLVAVVQSNYPQDNSSGDKGAQLPERLDFHVRQTQAAIHASPEPIDLVVWSETMMPEMNEAARAELSSLGDTDPQQSYDTIKNLALQNHVSLLVGGEYAIDFADQVRGGQTYVIPRDRRNSAYFFDRDGRMDESAAGRYDKIHLVPWGEFIPFKYSLPFLYRLSLSLGPNNYSDYELRQGDSDHLTVFQIPGPRGPWRFVTPICFEDIDSALCARMFCGGASGKKRADFLVNLTNDGWFTANENAQHLQVAAFRSIENRVPSARSVNTGISGFIDSTGRTSDLVASRKSGVSTQRLMLDSRYTFYSRFGDVFVLACLALTAVVAAAALIARRKRKMAANRSVDDAI